MQRRGQRRGKQHGRRSEHASWSTREPGRRTSRASGKTHCVFADPLRFIPAFKLDDKSREFLLRPNEVILVFLATAKPQIFAPWTTNILTLGPGNLYLRTREGQFWTTRFRGLHDFTRWLGDPNFLPGTQAILVNLRYARWINRPERLLGVAVDEPGRRLDEQILLSKRGLTALIRRLIPPRRPPRRPPLPPAVP